MLDLGCGTGVDAASLSALGFRVEAIDASSAMVMQARARGVAARTADLTDFAGRYDGALSNFGALNCLPDLAPLGERLAAVLPVGRYAVLVVLSRRCFVERLALMARIRRNRRRDGPVEVDGATVSVRYLDAGTVTAELGSAFRLVREEALGALVAPPDLGGRPGRRSELEPWLARLPLLRSQGDHTMLVFRRR